MMSLVELLSEYRQENRITSKGSLAVILYVSRKARQNGLPLDAASLKAGSAGQISGLSKGAVQAILSDYGITKVLAAEGGRTSRGSIRNMEDYVVFLNNMNQEITLDLDFIEAWWVDRVKEYFSSKPFVLKLDTGISLNSVVRDLLEQAEKRQRENPGTMYAGAVLQHLVGAKLQKLVGDSVEHHGFSVADAPTGRSGDFFVSNTVIHVTTSPSEALMEKCIVNLHSGIRPFIITPFSKLSAAKQLADIKDILHRIEIIDAEQFISTNIYEWSSFDPSRQRETIDGLINDYNALVEAYETDPSLRVDIG